MNELKQWFFDLSPRDQLMLVVGGGLLLVYILVFVVYFPMKDGLEQTERRNIAAMEEQQRVRELAGQVLATRAAGGDPAAGGGGSLNAALNSSLREHGLAMENFQPSGSGARVRLGTSEFTRVLAWLHDLEVKRGLHIRDLTITADPAPGAVVVNLQLQQGE